MSLWLWTETILFCISVRAIHLASIRISESCGTVFFGIFFSQKGYFIDNVIYIFEKENIFFTYFFAIKSSKRHYFLRYCKYSQFIRKILRFISIIIIHIIWNEHNCYYYCKIMVCIILTFYMTITCIYMVDSGPDVSHITLNELGHLQHEP